MHEVNGKTGNLVGIKNKRTLRDSGKFAYGYSRFYEFCMFEKVFSLYSMYSGVYSCMVKCIWRKRAV